MYKILLADDVKLTLASEKSYLEARNLRVFATTSPHEALDLASVVQPDLVVLDYEMPDRTGAEVCRDLKSNPQTAHIPVLILSIRDDEQILDAVNRSGASGFIRKADGREALLEGVASILGIPRRRHVRVPCRFTVGIASGGREFSGQVENISESGMFLTTTRHFSTGMALRLSFALPHVDQPIHMLGEIVRSEELTGENHGFGIQFLEMDPASRDGLARYLENSL